MNTIGKLIKDARIKAGISQEELANKIFVTKQSISKYENNHAIPSLEIKKLLEEELNIDLTIKEKSSQGFNKVLVLSFGILLLIGLVITTVISVRTNNDLLLLQSQYEDLTEDYDLLKSNYNLKSSNYSQLQADYSSQSDALYALVTENEDLEEELSNLYSSNTLTVNGLTIICDLEFIRITEEYISFRVDIYNSTDSSIWIDASLLSTNIRDGGLWFGDGYDINNNPLGSMAYRDEITSQDTEAYILTIHNRKNVEPEYDYLLLDEIVVYYLGEILTVIEIPDQI